MKHKFKWTEKEEGESMRGLKRKKRFNIWDYLISDMRIREGFYCCPNCGTVVTPIEERTFPFFKKRIVGVFCPTCDCQVWRCEPCKKEAKV